MGCAKSKSQTVEAKSLIKIDSNKILSIKIDFNKLKFISSLMDKQGKNLGKLYGMPLTNGSFSGFVVTATRKEKIIPIYLIDKNHFWNSNGKENIPITQDCIEYKLELIKMDRFTIYLDCATENKNVVSDPLTVFWDEKEKVFHVFFAP